MNEQANDRGYPLDLSSPARHLRTALDTAAGAAVSVSEVAQTYNHANSGDLTRVKRKQGFKSDGQAHEWMIGEAARVMGKWLSVQTVDGETWVSVKKGMKTDMLRIAGQAVHPQQDPHVVFRAPFDQNKIFAVNIRALGQRDNTDELEESFRTFGWIPEFPAIQDEHKVLLVGHRRIEVAKKLGIDPTPFIKTITFGDGDPADAKRLGIALASNLGSKPLTSKDRGHIAFVLHEGHDFSLNKIAEMLKVSQKTILNDTRGLVLTPNPKRGGRPRKSSISEQDQQAEKLVIEGKGSKDVSEQLNTDERHASQLVLRAKQRLEAKEQVRAEMASQAPIVTNPEPNDDEVICPHCMGRGKIPRAQ